MGRVRPRARVSFSDIVRFSVRAKFMTRFKSRSRNRVKVGL
jgi:hypothetical protein